MIPAAPNSSFVLPDQTCQNLTLAQIELATNNFDDTLIIGRGGFGNVYKSLSKFGSVNKVAIKRLHSTSTQGAIEFEAEVKLLSNLRHGNLVPLIGYCNEGNEMVIVYEFMPNGTLKDHLHRGITDLSWLQRLKICVGAARGLGYLHTGPSTQEGVIHRDVKTSNILLDSNFAAKISDFGLAKVGTINQTQTHVSTSVKGTFGYMDPCYVYSGKLTRKSDVYAFGVVLFEVLSGKQAVDQTLDEDQWSLAVWAQHYFKEGRLNKIIDHRLMGQISKKCLREFASIAVLCLDEQPKQRPTMAEVVVKLESILSRERENISSGINDGRLIDKVRYFFKGKADNSSPQLLQDHQISNNRNVRTFTYDELVSATNNFNDKEVCTYSHDTIYKGWVDELTYAPTKSGVGLAMFVRRSHIGTSELDIKPEEYNHPDHFKLLGYCLNGRLLYCVCKLIPDTGLDELLFGGTTLISWVARLKISVGAAEGLCFLHKKGHPAYCQFKTAFILVDTDYNARLREDYNARLLEANSFGSYTFEMDAHYAAPEWFRYQADLILDGMREPPSISGFGGFGVQSEVYSFGVVLLEILTRMKVFDWKRPEGKENLVKWATPLLGHEVNLGRILDTQLLVQDNNYPPKGAYKLALLVLKCLQPTQDDRPSMKEIVQVLRECYEEAAFDF